MTLCCSNCTKFTPCDRCDENACDCNLYSGKMGRAIAYRMCVKCKGDEMKENDHGLYTYLTEEFQNKYDVLLAEKNVLLAEKNVLQKKYDELVLKPPEKGGDEYLQGKADFKSLV